MTAEPRQQQQNRLTLARVALAVGIGLVPALVVFLTIAYAFGASPRQVVPTYNDEVTYWLQTAAFQTAGFDGGYCVIDEKPARVAFSHFGPHGPAFPAFYGTLARVVGWYPWSGPLFGGGLLAGALAWWVLTRSPSAIATALFAGSFWPAILAMPNTMQEPFHFAVAGAAATLIYRAARNDRPSVLLGVALLGLLALAALVRPVWGLLAIPCAGLLAVRWQRPVWLGLLGGVLVVAATYPLFMLVAAPSSTPAGALFFEIVDTPVEALEQVWHRMTAEHWPDFVSTEVEPFEILFRYELLAAALAAAVLMPFYRRGPQARQLAVAAGASTVLTIAILALGDLGSWRDYRTLTPVLFTISLLIGSACPAILWILVAVHLVYAPTAYRTFDSFHSPRFEESRLEDIERFANEVRPFLRFDRGASPWSNTVLVPVDQYQTQLLGLPKGMCATSAQSWDAIATPPRSRYLILPPPAAERLEGRVRMRKLVVTSVGTLYENLDWRR